MRTSAFPNAPSSFARRLGALSIALMLGLAGVGQAFADDLPVAPASGSAPEGSRSTLAPAAADDRNIDYPSQIGPEGPASTNARSAGRPFSAVSAPENADFAEQTAER